MELMPVYPRRSSGAMEEAVGVLCRFKGLLDVARAIVVLLVLALREGASRGLETVGGERFRSIGIAAILILIIVGMTPLGLMAAAPSENRFPQPAADIPPPFGIIVFGAPLTAWLARRGARSSSTRARE